MPVSKYPMPPVRLRSFLRRGGSALAGLVTLGAAFVFPRAEAADPAAHEKREPIRPIPLGVQADPVKAALGKRLFNDSRLSHDNTVSCASCHDLQAGGSDGRKFSLGIHGAEGTINAPTVFNSAGNFKQFWDGRAATLEAQIDGPVHAADELGSNWPEIVGKLQGDADYVASFRKIYADGLQPENIKNAIAEFERTLNTPNSRFDRYLRGEQSALSSEEKEGYQKFKAYGCASCHQGVYIGGNMFATLGAMDDDYFTNRGGVTAADNGRFNVTKDEEDRHVFKVPSLRNVARTAPYFHDGSAKTLERAVSVMARYQLGERIPAEDVQKLVKFLETLTGEYEGRPL